MPRIRNSRRKPARNPARTKKNTAGWAAVLFFAFIILAIAEIKLGFVERTAGNYLTRHNDQRPAWGTFWQQEEKTRQASRKIEGESAASSRLRQQAERAATFNDLLDLVSDDETVSITPAKFVGLYLSLPEIRRILIIKPSDLLTYYHTSDWRRTLIRKQSETGIALLLDSRDQTLTTLTLSPESLAPPPTASRIQSGGLAGNPAFTGRIYPGEKFLSYIFILPESERNQLFPDTETLLALPKPILQVGLAPNKDGGFAYIGFETTSDAGLAVISYPIPQTTFERLSFALAWEGSDTLFQPRMNEQDEFYLYDEDATTSEEDIE